MSNVRPDRLLLKEAMTKEGLGELWEDFEKVLRPTIFLRKGELVDDENIPVGASKFGGFPDLPPDLDLPVDSNSEVCSLVVQVDLADIATLDEENLLPKTGLLSFFMKPIDGGQSKMNADPVLYFPEGTVLERRKNLVSEYDVYFEQDICMKFAQGFTYPYDASGIESELTDKLSNFHINGIETDELCFNAYCPQIFGYPDYYQGQMEPGCELIRCGIEASAEWHNENKTFWEELEKHARKDWVCLLDFAEPFGVFTYSYMIHREDLANRDFAKVICIPVN
jgi:uncharacterized protein YwqG